MSARPARAVLLSILALLARDAALGAQETSVRGRVVHAATDAPIADADVAVAGGPRAARTGADGRFVLRGLGAGTVSLTVRRVGFAPTELAVTPVRGEPTNVVVRLVPAPALLAPIVTAGGTARSLAEVPAAVTVADSVALHAGRTVAMTEALRTMPGVQGGSRYGTDDVNLSVRGASARTRLGTRGVGVLLDGVPLSEPDGVTRFDLVEMVALRQVEVVRGPVLALYPSQSAGVINLVSRTGAEVDGATLRARRGGNGFEKYDGIAGSALGGGRSSVMAAASYTWMDGWRQHSQSRVLRGTLGAEWRVGARGALAFEASGAQLDSDWPGALTQAEYDADPDAANAFARPYELGRDDDRYRVGLRMAQGVFEDGAVSGFLYYGGRAFALPTLASVITANFHRVQGGVRLRSGFAAGSPVEVTIGAEYDRFFGDDYRHTPRNRPVDSIIGHAELSIPNLALYAQTAWRVARTLDLLVGVRYDEVRYRSVSRTGGIAEQERSVAQLSPKATLAWRPGRRTSLYASVARGFEPLLVAEVNPVIGAPLNQSTPPKSLWNYEVGGRTALGARVLVDVAAYWQDVRNDFVVASRDGEQVVQSASRTRGVGVEAGLTVLVAPWLDAVASYTLADFRYRDFTALVTDAAGGRVVADYAGNRFPGVAPHRVAGEVRVRPLRSLGGVLQVEWQAGVFVENGNADAGTLYVAGTPGQAPQAIPFRRVADRALVHLQATWSLGPVALLGSVENLLGTRYVGNVVVNEASGRFYESGPGRWITLGAGVAVR